MKIQVENIRVNKFNTNEITVTFNNGAEMVVNANTLTTDETTVVYTEKSTLKAERFTKKYKQAFETYLFNCKVDVITHEENERKIEYRVYQVGSKIIAHKVDFATKEIMVVRDWTHYETLENAINDMSNTNNWHYKYSFYVISEDMSHTTATAIANDIEKTVNFEMTDSDTGNLISTIAHAINDNVVLYAFIVDGEKSIHMAFKYQEGTKENMFKVNSCYNNGLGDRTTYNGLFRGSYNILSYYDAENVLRNRANKAKGSHAMQELAF